MEKRTNPAQDKSEPTIKEHQWSYEITDRYYLLTSFYEFIQKFNPVYIPPVLTDDDKAFLAECDAGLLAQARGIQKRYQIAKGTYRPPATGEFLVKYKEDVQKEHDEMMAIATKRGALIQT